MPPTDPPVMKPETPDRIAPTPPPSGLVPPLEPVPAAGLSRLENALARLSENPPVPAEPESEAGVDASKPASTDEEERRSFPRRESGCVVSVRREFGTTPYP